MSNTVTQEYLNGILDARKFWRDLPADERVSDAQAYLDNIKRTMATFSPGPVKDHLRGERDFWAYQIKHL